MSTTYLDQYENATNFNEALAVVLTLHQRIGNILELASGTPDEFSRDELVDSAYTLASDEIEMIEGLPTGYDYGMESLEDLFYADDEDFE